MKEVNFTCEVSGSPITSIHIGWTWTTSTLDDRNNITITTIPNNNLIVSVLTIHSLQLSDAGLYKCTASLEGLTRSIAYNLTIGMYVCS